MDKKLERKIDSLRDDLEEVIDLLQEEIQNRDILIETLEDEIKVLKDHIENLTR